MSSRTNAEAEATFIFAGVVVATGATTMPEVTASESTVVVSIERVLLAPPAFADRSGEVTVLLPEGYAVAAGVRRVFYCVGWIYGSGLALRALEAAPEDTRPMASIEPGDPAEAFQERALRDRIGGADLVVRGRVSDVRSAPVASDKPPGEHDADWHEAVVQVESVLKGTAPGGDLLLRFPLSRDIAWVSSPKFHYGQTGVWLLRGAPESPVSEEGAQAPSPSRWPTFTALDPLDFHSADEAARVSSLAGSD